MSVALRLPNIPVDQTVSVRADKVSGPLQGAQEESGAEFASFLSELAAGPAVSEKLTKPLSGPDPQTRGDDGSDRTSRTDASAGDTSGAAEAAATPSFIDPSWSMLATGIGSPLRESASNPPAPDASADRPGPSNVSSAASSLLESGQGRAAESERGQPNLPPITLGQALAAAARSAPLEPAHEDGVSAPPQSALAEAESAATSSLESASEVSTARKLWEPSGGAPTGSSSRTVSRAAGPAEAIESVSHQEKPFTSESHISPVAPGSARMGRSTDETAPETIREVKIQSLETHLPVALSSIVVAQARSSFGIGETERPNVSVAIAPASVAVDTQNRSGAAPTKLLTIQLEPESLGTVTVKMKMSRSGIDMQIRVDSAEALRALDATRDKLVDAMQSSGCTVDSCTIQVASPTAGSDGSQSMAHGSSRQDAASSGSASDRQESFGREGVNDDGRGGYRREEAGSGREETSPDIAPRRAARVGDVYL